MVLLEQRRPTARCFVAHTHAASPAAMGDAAAHR